MPRHLHEPQPARQAHQGQGIGQPPLPHVHQAVARPLPQRAPQGLSVEGQHLRPRRLVEPVRTVVHLEAREVERARQAPHPLGRLEHHHALARLDERMRRGQPRGPRANDHHGLAHPTPPTAGSSSAVSVLGARPARSHPMPRTTVRPMRQVSPTGRHFERPTRG